MELVRYILGELSVIRGAPVAFILSIVAAGILIYYLMTWGYGRENSYLRTQLDDYKEKLKGATPQEARDRIDALEAAAKATIGKRWEPLSSSEIDSVADRLKSLSITNAQISYENDLGKALADSLAMAFKKAGWQNVQTFTGGTKVDPGIAIGFGEIGSSAKQEIERFTSLRFSSLTDSRIKHMPGDPPGTTRAPDYVRIAIGIRSN